LKQNFISVVFHNVRLWLWTNVTLHNLLRDLVSYSQSQYSPLSL